jgi:hypothetical protein
MESSAFATQQIGWHRPEKSLTGQMINQCWKITFSRSGAKAAVGFLYLLTKAGHALVVIERFRKA